MHKKLLITRLILAILWLIAGIITIITNSVSPIAFGALLVCYIVEIICSVLREWKS